MTADVHDLRPRPDTDLPWQPEAELEEPDTKPGPHDLRMFSVTTICRTMGTPDALVGWAARRAAVCALDDLEVWQPMVERRQRDAAVNYIAGARFRPRAGSTLSDADVGTAFHKAAEQWIFDGKRPSTVPEAEPLLDSFGQWLDTAQPTYEALEMTVYNVGQRYAGTLDAIIRRPEGRYVVDYKTSLDDDDGKFRKRPWHDVALQLSAYRAAEHVAVWKARRHEQFSRRYYLLSEDERRRALPMPPIVGGYCLHVTPYHCDLYPVACGPDVYTEGFLAAVNAAEWVYRLSDSAIDFDGATLLNTGTR